MLSYHVVVHALEARTGIGTMARYWLALQHAASGHLPYARYQAAGLQREREKASSSAIERWVDDWLATDVNPAVQTVRMADCVRAVLDGFNTYNAHACLAVRTQAMGAHDEATGQFSYSTHRRLLGTAIDPEPCKLGTLTVLERLVSETARRSRCGERGQPLSLAHVARRLGVEHSAAAEVAQVVEEEGPVTLSDVARHAGCSARTLQRRLEEEGGSVQTIRLAQRMVRATRLLQSTLSLTQVAAEAGFSDAAHMSRSMKQACGMSPSMLRATLAQAPAPGRFAPPEGWAQAMQSPATPRLHGAPIQDA